MVARHRELGQLLLDPEADERVFDRELVAESETVVIESETDQHDGGFLFGGVVHALHTADGLFQSHQHFVVMVADVRFFAPHGFPRLIKSAVCFVFDDEGVRQIVAPFEGEAHARGQYHGFAVAEKRILWLSVHHGELKFQLTVRTLQRQCICRHGGCFGVMLGE